MSLLAVQVIVNPPGIAVTARPAGADGTDATRLPLLTVDDVSQAETARPLCDTARTRAA